MKTRFMNIANFCIYIYISKIIPALCSDSRSPAMVGLTDRLG